MFVQFEVIIQRQFLLSNTQKYFFKRHVMLTVIILGICVTHLKIKLLYWRYWFHEEEPLTSIVTKDYGSVAEIPVLCLPVLVSAEAAESMRYWEQFRQAQPQENTAEEREKSKKRNMRLVGYCMLTMLLSLSVHYFGFR